MSSPEQPEGKPEVESVSIRPVAAKDSADVWRIRNTESVRQVSHQQDEIPWEKHQAWFQQYLENPDNHCSVIEVDGRIGGYCRIDGGLVSIAIDPAFHGRGLGKKLLEEAVRAAAALGQPVRAEVKKDNRASLKLFTSVGFKTSGENEEQVTFTYEPETET